MPMYKIEGFKRWHAPSKRMRTVRTFRTADLETARRMANRIFEVFGIVVAITMESKKGIS